MAKGDSKTTSNKELRQCRMTNTWPTRTEDIQVLDL